MNEMFYVLIIGVFLLSMMLINNYRHVYKRIMLRNNINYGDIHGWKIQLQVALMISLGTILVIRYGNLEIPVYIQLLMPLPILLRPFILKIRYPGYTMTGMAYAKEFVKIELDNLEAEYKELEFRRTSNDKVKLVTIKSKNIQRTK